MTDPATVQQLDQQVIDTGRALAAAHLDPQADKQRIDQARDAYLAALGARWPDA